MLSPAILRSGHWARLRQSGSRNQEGKKGNGDGMTWAVLFRAWEEGQRRASHEGKVTVVSFVNRSAHHRLSPHKKRGRI